MCAKKGCVWAARDLLLRGADIHWRHAQVWNNSLEHLCFAILEMYFFKNDVCMYVDSANSSSLCRRAREQWFRVESVDYVFGIIDRETTHSVD